MKREGSRDSSLEAAACLELPPLLILVWRRADRDSVSVSSEAQEKRRDLESGLL